MFKKQDDNEHRATLGRFPWAASTGWFSKSLVRVLVQSRAAGCPRFGAKCDLTHWHCAHTHCCNCGDLCCIYRACKLASLEVECRSISEQTGAGDSLDHTFSVCVQVLHIYIFPTQFCFAVLTHEYLFLLIHEHLVLSWLQDVNLVFI